MEMVSLGLSTYQTHDTCMQNHPTHKKVEFFLFQLLLLNLCSSYMCWMILDAYMS
jgi:hypothetical protein